MFTRKVIALSILAGLASHAAAQTGRYYLTDESGINNIWQVQGGSLVATFPPVPVGPRHGPIIVDGFTSTVRSTVGGFSGGAVVPGSEYFFNGTPTTALSLDFSAWGGHGRVVDAGFDGSSTYICSGLFGTAGVFRYGVDFSGPGVKLFTPNANAQGITYDSTRRTIWTSDYDLTGGIGHLREWDISTGTMLFSFPVTNPAGINSERNTALAYDASDDTFWVNAHVENTLGMGIGELWQFDRNGNFLQATNPRPGLLYWGGEIFTVPSPSIALAGFVGLMLARRRR